MSNNLAQQKPRFSVAITTPAYQKLINNTLGDPNRAKRFIATITSAVATNPALQECDAGTILAGALLGESLNLSPSPQLGQFYLVPFHSKEKVRNGEVIEPETTKATFVLGYKGYIQLAIRSGQYKKLTVMEIKQGELIRFDPLTEEIQCEIIEDYEEREKAPTEGYYAMFEYINGFRKAIYWSRKKMIQHADHFSKAFSKDSFEKIQSGEISDRDMWKYSSFWYKNFDDMAKKTMLRQLISRWGIMSTEMQTAFERDETMNETDSNGSIFSDIPAKKEMLKPEAEEIVEKVDLGNL